MADHNNPQSRTEEILIATIDGTEYDKLPQSRLEELLLELKEVIEAGGGGGGTTNYNLLSNKPQINGVTLSGEMTASDLSLVLAEVGKGLSTNDYSDEEKAKVADLITAIEGILTGTDLDSFGDVETALADKVDKVNGKGLSTNDFTDEYKAAIGSNTSAITAIKDGSELDSFGDVEVALLDKADTSDLGTAAAKDSTNSVTAGSTDLVESGAVKDAIDTAVAAAYHHAGTKTVAQLTHDLLIAANEGNVYNITDSGTTTSDFIEGIGKQIDAGDNVGICKVGNVYMFDLLSGLEDTSGFVRKSQTSGLLKNDGTVNTTIEDTVAGHTTALAGKQDTLTFDDTPTDGSNNPVKSNGIYDSEKDIYAAMGEKGAKNLIKYPFATNSGNTYRGITFTYNDSQILYANGTTDASKEPYFNHVFSSNKVLLEADKKYILSIESDSEHAFGDIWFRAVSDYTSITVAVNATYSDGDTLSATLGHISTKKSDDTIVPYVIFSVATSVYAEIQTRYNSGSHVISNKYSKTMVRLASDTDNTWQPYAKTNKQLTDEIALKQDKYETITYAQWQQLTPAQQAAKDYYISDYPSSVLTAGNIAYDNTSSGMAANKVQGAIDELKSGLTGINYTLNDSVKGENITRLRGNVNKISNVVTITGAWTGSATNTDVITLIPEGFRPSGAETVIGVGTINISDTLAYAEYTVLSDGRLRQAQVVGAVSGGTFTFCYAI